MKITNKYDLPDYVYAYLAHDDYDYESNTITATGLMQPIQMYALKKRYAHKLEIDASDLIASRYGTAIHDSIEKVQLPYCKQEQRLRTIIKGIKVTGKFDILRWNEKTKEHELIDVKSTSVWSWVYGGKEKDYQTQLSIYRWLAYRNGTFVSEKAKIWMFFTDWNRSKSTEFDYPTLRTAIKPVKLWDIQDTEAWVYKRIEDFLLAEKTKLNLLPRCTDEELWRPSPTFKVMKKNRKSAIRNFNNLEDAEEHKAKHKDSFIVSVPSKAKRCIYCVCRPVCLQYKEMLSNDEVEE